MFKKQRNITYISDNNFFIYDEVSFVNIKFLYSCTLLHCIINLKKKIYYASTQKIVLGAVRTKDNEKKKKKPIGDWIPLYHVLLLD